MTVWPAISWRSRRRERRFKRSFRNTAARWKEGISDRIACTGNKCIAVGVCGGKRTAHLYGGGSCLLAFFFFRNQLLLLPPPFPPVSTKAAGSPNLPTFFLFSIQNFFRFFSAFFYI